VPEDVTYHPVSAVTAGRRVPAVTTCPECRARGDWAAVVVHVVEPWLGPVVGPQTVPGEVAKVTVVEGGDEPTVRIDLMRHGGVPGVAGHLVVELLTAEEAGHLANLLYEAVRLAFSPPGPGRPPAGV
jgi:hypothetical protein